MEKLGLNEIRERYLSFFESKGHLRLPSFPLVPQNDNSLLLINAGMAPLKPYFTGKEQPPRTRVTTCQKCIRTPDIERVGKTSRHGTFFEMLGNFSFGDYFKKEAIAWAWEFLTEEMKMPKDRLWVSVYEEDDEAEDLWKSETDIEPSRIVRMGKEDNFWEIGTGPCGPCSEIYFDRGPENGCGDAACAPGCDCDRFVEVWNLVFTQFDKDEDGVYHRLSHPNIDTGMGMERLAAMMQGVSNLFEVDTVANIMGHISKVADVEYGRGEQSDISLRVITDHIRSTVFLIADGVIPSNEGRGYVLRRLLRRAARHGKLLGIRHTFLSDIADTVAQENRSAYPELTEKLDYIKKIIINEEESFDKTIDTGLSILNEYIGEIKAAGANTLSGSQAFKLYDTYGFPVDLTLEILCEHQLDVDLDGFSALMQEQRQRARAAREDSGSAGWDDGIFGRLGNTATKFLGYTAHECEATLLAIITDDQLSDSVSTGEHAVLVLDQTVFYGESGGQIGDTGFITGKGRAVVEDTKKLANGIVLHHITMQEGALTKGDRVLAKIDVRKRQSTARNHSATHLLQKALRTVLGNHVAQSGSFVNEEYLRFDFTHFAPMTEEEILRVEDLVNEAILDSYDVDISYGSIDEAKKAGVLALFGEKYGDIVRVVRMGDYSAELCGGCHISNTSQIGLFKILRESGIAAGTRRIEAITAMAMLENMREAEKKLKDVAAILKTTPTELANRAEGFLTDLRTAHKEIDTLRARLAGGSVDSLISSAQHIGELSVITGRLDDLDMDGLRNLGDKLKSQVQNAVIVLASSKDGKVNFVAMATKTAVESGANAGGIIREIASITGGGGGGRPDSAQAGGKDVAKIDDALKSAAAVVDKFVKK